MNRDFMKRDFIKSIIFYHYSHFTSIHSSFGTKVKKYFEGLTQHVYERATSSQSSTHYLNDKIRFDVSKEVNVFCYLQWPYIEVCYHKRIPQ